MLVQGRVGSSEDRPHGSLRYWFGQLHGRHARQLALWNKDPVSIGHSNPGIRRDACNPNCGKDNWLRVINRRNCTMIAR